MSEFKHQPTDGLQVENITAAYGKKDVLRGISFTATKGITALFGLNGAGKSTILKTIAGTLKPSHGQIKLGGVELNNHTIAARVRLGIAYCAQGGSVFPSLTVMENLEVAVVTLPDAERKANKAEVLEFFPNLRGLLRRRAGLLSGGERQSLAIAMALVKRPRLLLIDEPSAGLSPNLANETIQKIGEINRTWQTTILMVEQNIREAVKVADRALIVVSGAIASETVKPAELLEGDKLEQVFMATVPSPIRRQGQNQVISGLLLA